MKPLITIAWVTGVIVLCTLLPYLPGPYDSVSGALSGMSQFLGLAGVLLVPVGALWWLSGYSKRPEAKQFAFGVAALIASSVVALIVPLGFFASGGWSLAAGALILWVHFVRKTTRRLSALKTAAKPPAAAVYMTVVPIAVLILQLLLVGRAVDFARSRAIANSQRLIADIENYRAMHGRYPVSLLGLWPDYKPSVLWIERYHYEPSGEAYNLVFKQSGTPLGTMEMVVYNPRDEQVAYSHPRDLLEFSGQALEVRRGFYAVRETQYPHWKYFLFD